MSKEKIKFIISKDSSQSSAVIILYSEEELQNSCNHNVNLEKFTRELISKNNQASIYIFDKLKSSNFKPQNSESILKKIIKEVDELGLKRISLTGLLETGSLASILLAEKYPKLIRRLVLLDPNVRKTPSMCCFILDKLESFLPCGLPLRNSKENKIDLRGHIHRINCPSLVISSKSGSFYSRKSIRFLKRRLPNTWCLELEESMVQESSTLNPKAEELIFSFLKTPSKRPQKILTKEESQLILEEASNHSDF